MANSNFQTKNEVLSLSQRLVQDIRIRHKGGDSPEKISSFLGLRLEQVQQVIAHDRTKTRGKTLFLPFVHKSKKYRCAHSGKLMASPVITPTQRVYDQSSLKSAKLSFPEESLQEVPILKEEIQIFSKSNLQHLDFSSANDFEDELNIAAECLSVLNVDSELDSFLSVLTPLNKNQLELAFCKLHETIPEEGLINLLFQLADLENFQLISLLLVKELMQQPLQDFETVFSYFIRILCQTSLCSEALDLVEELKTRLTAEQLIQVIEALSMHERDQLTQLATDEFRLYVAYLKNEDKVTAISLLKPLYPKPEMKQKLEAFFESTGWKDEQTQFYQAVFMECLRNLGESNVADGFRSVFQLFSHKLNFHEDTQRRTCSAELSAVKRDFNQNLIYQSQQLIGYQSEFRLLKNETRHQLSNAATYRSENAQELAELGQRTSQIDMSQTALQAQVQAEIRLIRQTLEELEEHCRRLDKRPHKQLIDSHSPHRKSLNALEELKYNISDSTSVQFSHKLPTHTFGYNYGKSTLFITDLKTGLNTIKTIPSYKFKGSCSWCALPPSSLCFTGGGDFARNYNEVVIIDPKNCTVSTKTPMPTARRSHGSVWHEGYVYAIGGSIDNNPIEKCERYSVSEDRWQVLQPLPTAVDDFGIVTQEASRSLYVIGGYRSDLILKFVFKWLEWNTLAIKLPSIDSHSLAVFKVSEQEFFFVQNSKLYAFYPSSSKIMLVKPLSANIQSWWGPSYYSNDTLYCSFNDGAVQQLVIGSLS